MALSLGINSKGSNATNAATASRTTTAGSSLFLVVTSTTATQPTISDTVGGSATGNTWTVIGAGAQIDALPARIWMFKQIGGARGATHVVTAARQDTTALLVEILGTSPDVDVSNQGVDTSSTFGDLITVTPTVADFILLAGISGNAGGVNNYVPGASMTEVIEEQDGGLWWSCSLASRIVTGGSGSYGPSWTNASGPANTAHVVAVFKEGGAAATKAPPPFKNSAARLAPLLRF